MLALSTSPSASALRLPSLSSLKLWREEQRAEARQEVLLHEVLSPLSEWHPERSQATDSISRASAAAGHSAGALSLAPSWRDPAVETVFSADAARRFPRLASGPSLPLAPWAGRPAQDGDGSLPQPEEEMDGGLADTTRGSAAEAEAGSSSTTTATSGTSATTTATTAEAVGAADPPPPELDLPEALLAGRLASIAYCSHTDLLAAWNCSRCADVPGFSPYRVVYDAVWDLVAYAGFYTPWRAIVLVFRGTDSSNWGQWAENMRAWRTDHMYPEPGFPHALIHAGFYTLWTGSSLQTTFTAAVSELVAAHPGARLVAIGHSMGGALAQLAALEVKLAYSNVTGGGGGPMHATVYTFGAPRVGNLAYQQLFNSFIDVSWRFTHNRDVVPSVPLQLMGFQHVAREVWEVDVDDPGAAGGVERKLLICDGSGEDPSCHNSACYLGLCTSVADHLVYLGVHMYQDSEEC
ncbi:hypothetical protein HYH02_012184 [Chlamydomonas schloesseri]|uniref:Fungal lipase-type domain-containing protein n=1 Tax=Chlamydomonas schloesseri TaxID=2026947 RepID=A0A835VZ04_9CHLO|nr:hypothetical protein HYH02_012184 [Chlamydomonas schloesseri]|eukprot:KAG2434517.1 hypothetical protein HYH02_012184 [Chlamydomonas schloesseri]